MGGWEVPRQTTRHDNLGLSLPLESWEILVVELNQAAFFFQSTTTKRKLCSWASAAHRIADDLGTEVSPHMQITSHMLSCQVACWIGMLANISPILHAVLGHQVQSEVPRPM